MLMKKILRYLSLMGIGLILSVLLVKITDKIFVDLIFNLDKKVDQWDILNGLLGYYKELPPSEETYIELQNNLLVTTPYAIQLIGLFYSISFIRIPLSYHTMVKPRLTKNWDYIYFFMKESIHKAIGFGVTIFLVLLIVLHTNGLTSVEGSFRYQTGNIYLALTLYAITLTLMIMALSLTVFYMYSHNKGIFGVLIVALCLLVVNLFDRNTTGINLILFDKVNGFLDSLLFWSGLIIVQGLYLSKITFRQEEYND